MTKLGIVRTVVAVVALTTAQVALAAAPGEPTFEITSAGWWSLLGTGVFSFGLVWIMRKWC